MKDERPLIQPKDFLTVLLSQPLSDQEKEALLFLYQPIIGAYALSLYLTLLFEAESALGISESFLHADLITLTDLSREQLQAAFLKLEGIGLLKSYVKEDTQLGRLYVYHLQMPEQAARFFQDHLLTFMLLQAVGQRKMDKLFAKFQPKQMDLTDYQPISASFRSVYAFQETQFLSETPQLSAMQESFAKLSDKASLLQASAATFDWAFFLTQLQQRKLQLPEDAEKFQQEVLLFHQMYGLDELEMADAALKSFDYYSNQIELATFQRTVYQLFSNVPKQTTALKTNAQPPEMRVVALKKEGFSELDIQVILEYEKYAPLPYLEGLKEKRGGYVTPQERTLLKYLLTNARLPKSVINALVYYVYVIQKQPTLQAEYVNRIANDWAEKKIFSPEQAIQHVRQLVQKSKARQEKRTNNRRTAPIRQETLPDWAQHPEEDKKISKERQAQLDRELRELLGEEGEQ